MQLAEVPSFLFQLSEVDISLQDVFYHFIAIINKKAKRNKFNKDKQCIINNVISAKIQLLINFFKNFIFKLARSIYQDLLQYCTFQQTMYETQNEVPNWQLLKELCLKQNRQFQEWQKQKDYDRFHHSHYDWWAFPINRRSSYGDKYKLSNEDRDVLIKDQQFLQALRSNAILVCESWGFDLVKGEEIQLKEKDQKWQDWPIRLYKLANSLQFFYEMDLFFNAIKFGLRLIKEGNDFTYGSKNLKPLFFKNQEELQYRERIKMDKKDAQFEKIQKVSNESLGKSYEAREKVEQKVSTLQESPEQTNKSN